jgi:Ran GTPase-activating protein (RanGAP) involved in mRNA processing and transport/ankyrin repeat protein
MSEHRASLEALDSSSRLVAPDADVADELSDPEAALLAQLRADGLRTLDLGAQPGAFARLRRRLPDAVRASRSLRRLVLRGCGFGDADAALLASALRDNASLRAVVLARNALTPRGAASLGGALRRQDCPLASLDLSQSTGLGDDGVGALAAALEGGGAPRLSELILGEVGAGVGACAALRRALLAPACACALTTLELWANPRMGPAGVAELAAVLLGARCALTHLGLRATGAGDEGADELARALAAGGAGDGGDGVGGAARGCPLRVLDLRANGIGDAGAGMLAVALRGGGSALEALDLWSNVVTDAGVGLLAEALRHNGSLTRLSLQFNSFGAEGASLLGEALASPRCGLRELSLWGNALLVDGAAALGRGLARNRTVRELRLWSNGIGAAGGAAIGAALGNLTSLDLFDNRLGNAGTAALAQCLGAHSGGRGVSAAGSGAMGRLLRLRLERNGVGAGGARALSAALLARGAALQHLDLSNNELGVEGAAVLADALKSNTTLRTLLLWRNRVGTDGAEAFAEALRCNGSLRCLDLEDNGVGSRGVASLGAAVREGNTALATLRLLLHRRVPARQQEGQQQQQQQQQADAATDEHGDPLPAVALLERYELEAAEALAAKRKAKREALAGQREQEQVARAARQQRWRGSIVANKAAWTELTRDVVGVTAAPPLIEQVGSAQAQQFSLQEPPPPPLPLAAPPVAQSPPSAVPPPAAATPAQQLQQQMEAQQELAAERGGAASPPPHRREQEDRHRGWCERVVRALAGDHADALARAVGEAAPGMVDATVRRAGGVGRLLSYGAGGPHEHSGGVAATGTEADGEWPGFLLRPACGLDLFEAGDTALHLAAKNGRAQCCRRLLLHLGAARARHNKVGKTPEQCCDASVAAMACAAIFRELPPGDEHQAAAAAAVGAAVGTPARAAAQRGAAGAAEQLLRVVAAIVADDGAAIAAAFRAPQGPTAGSSSGAVPLDMRVRGVRAPSSPAKASGMQGLNGNAGASPRAGVRLRFFFGGGGQGVQGGVVVGGVELRSGPDTAGGGLHADAGDTALHLACRNGRGAAVRALLELGADDQALNRVGRTPHACTTAHEPGRSEVLGAFEAHKAARRAVGRGANAWEEEEEEEEEEEDERKIGLQAGEEAAALYTRAIACVEQDDDEGLLAVVEQPAADMSAATVFRHPLAQRRRCFGDAEQPRTATRLDGAGDGGDSGDDAATVLEGYEAGDSLLHLCARCDRPRCTALLLSIEFDPATLDARGMPAAMAAGGDAALVFEAFDGGGAEALARLGFGVGALGGLAAGGEQQAAVAAQEGREGEGESSGSGAATDGSDAAASRTAAAAAAELKTEGELLIKDELSKGGKDEFSKGGRRWKTRFFALDVARAQLHWWKDASAAKKVGQQASELAREPSQRARCHNCRPPRSRSLVSVHRDCVSI